MNDQPGEHNPVSTIRRRVRPVVRSGPVSDQTGVASQTRCTPFQERITACHIRMRDVHVHAGTEIVDPVLVQYTVTGDELDRPPGSPIELECGHATVVMTHERRNDLLAGKKVKERQRHRVNVQNTPPQARRSRRKMTLRRSSGRSARSEQSTALCLTPVCSLVPVNMNCWLCCRDVGFRDGT
jgi:hypothetical protein